ncbi:MAG: Uma2 family endonuclease [Pyrinomonadaceae bacterium]|nr:Uma2 family endonuclease [Pyrinomonadaceae bacterium]
MSAVVQQIGAKISPRIETSDGFSIRKISVEDYEKMIDIGIFDEDDRVELLDGVIIEMNPKKTKHTIVNYLIGEFFYDNFRKQTIVRLQEPIILDDFSEPKPDAVLAQLPLLKYLETHPTAADVLLVVEVSDTTLAKDRRKASNYARAGIVQYLLFNLNTDEIEDYREPAADGYRFKQTHDRTAIFNLVAFPEVEIKVADLLPPESVESAEEMP